MADRHPPIDEAPTLAPRNEETLPSRPRPPAVAGPLAGRLTPQSDPEFFARYDLGPVLGQGGMGVVYRGTERSRGREVAIKFMLMVTPRMAGRFNRERELLSKLEHPNVVEFLDSGEAGGLPFLVMELMRGRSLREHLTARGGRLPLEEALPLFRKVLDGVEYVHTQAAIHRDLKPPNIFLDDNGGVKVGDFGLAYYELDESLSSTGEMMGTASYMPPEQFEGPVHAATADIYSLGVVLYEMVTGRLPIEEQSYSEISLAHKLNRRPRSIRNLDAALPRWLDDCLQAMLEKRPDRRPHTIRQLRGYLRPPDSDPGTPAARGAVVTELPTIPGGSPPDLAMETADWLAVGVLIAGLALSGWAFHSRTGGLPEWPVVRTASRSR